MGKNIVVLCDGTWNSPNSKSNIYLLYKELLERDYQQHVLYIDGIGVGEMAFGFIIDGAIALSLDAKIKKAPNDQIIIYGGTRTTDEVDFNQVYPDVLVLDTKKDPYEITAPDISTNTGIFPSLAGHTANLFGYYMIVAFGNTTHKDDEPSLGKNGIIYVMDIRNFTWINSLDLDQTADNKTSSPPSQSSNNDKTKLILASVLGVLGGALVLVGGFFAYRWINKRKKEKKVPGFFGSNFDRYDAGFPGTPVDNSKSPTEACKK